MAPQATRVRLLRRDRRRYAIGTAAQAGDPGGGARLGQVLVNLAWVAKLFGEDGALRSDEGMEAASEGMLDELEALDRALRVLHSE